MASESTTRWPLLNERTAIAPAAARQGAGRPPRSVWLLTGLAFLCGGLISAAGFSIGWRHQAQRNTDAETALATATARTHALERHVAALQATLAGARRAETRAHQSAAEAAASKQAVVSAAAKIGADATATSSAAGSVSAGAGALTATADRIASELKTLETYLTTTPTGELDPGYIASQTGYLTRQLGKLQTAGGTLGASIGSFEAALRKLTRSAGTLSTR
jgi:putative drug exporter of the RND superfamily